MGAQLRRLVGMSVLRITQPQLTHGCGQDFTRQSPATPTQFSFGYRCPITTVCWCFQSCINTPNDSLAIANVLHYLSQSPHSHFTCIFSPRFILTLALSPRFTLALPLMNLRAKNKSAHPAASVMTPAQLTAAGIPQKKHPRRGPTKDQRIAALEEKLRATQELLQMVFPPLLLRRLYLFTIIHRTTLLGQVVLVLAHRSCLTTVVTRSQRPTMMMSRHQPVAREVPQDQPVVGPSTYAEPDLQTTH
jgi:hypothetical protein